MTLGKYFIQSSMLVLKTQTAKTTFLPLPTAAIVTVSKPSLKFTWNLNECLHPDGRMFSLMLNKDTFLGVKF